MSTRDDVLRLQKAILRSITAEIDEHLGPPPAELRRFRAAYNRATSTYRSQSSRTELLAHLARADIVLCGDFHTLAQSQRTALRMLRDLHALGRPLSLGLEALPAASQAFVDSFMAGDLDEASFLTAVNWNGVWGFPFEHYRPLFEFARDHGIPVTALNTKSQAGGRCPTLTARDRFVAAGVTRLLRSRPDALLVVLFGDLHLAPPHLPRHIDEALARVGLRRRLAVVYQNSERIYWRLAQDGLLERVDVVRVDDRSYCVLGTPPWIKLQSYLEWLENADRTLGEADSFRESREAAYEEEIYRYAREIAEFLALPTTGLEGFDLVTVDSVARLGDLVGRRRRPSLSLLVSRSNCLFFPDERVVFLAAVDVSHAAEAAAELVHVLASGHGSDDGATRDAFYRRVLRRALAFFGSMLVNHKRKCWYFRDHDLFVRAQRGRAQDARTRELVRVSRQVLRHQRAEDKLLEGGSGRLHLPSLYGADVATGFAVSRALGYIMGDKLYRGLLQHVLRRSDLTRLFRSPFDAPDEAPTTYLRWRARLKRVVKRFTSKEQFF